MFAADHRLLLVAMSLSWLVACGGPTITGSVTDVEGTPLEGSTVTVVGTLSQTKVGPDGTFSISTKPGEYQVIVAQQGYISKDVDLTIEESIAYDLGRMVLIKIPDGTGLFLFDGASYTTMDPGWVERRLDGPKVEPNKKDFCVEKEKSPVNEIGAGTIPFFAKEAGDWHVFRLDDEGCARRMSRKGGTWSIDYSERPDQTDRDVGSEQTVSLVEMPAGEYFVALWHNGTFIEDKSEREEGEDKLFKGFYVVVE